MGTKDIETLKIVVGKPTLFLINKVEEFHIFLQGYSLSKNDGNLILNYIDNDFSSFIKNLSPEEEEVRWYRSIRYNSSTDSHSLELLRNYFIPFLEELEGNR